MSKKSLIATVMIGCVFCFIAYTAADDLRGSSDPAGGDSILAELQQMNQTLWDIKTLMTEQAVNNNAAELARLEDQRIRAGASLAALEKEIGSFNTALKEADRDLDDMNEQAINRYNALIKKQVAMHLEVESIDQRLEMLKAQSKSPDE